MDAVDRFVVVESNRTFAGAAKPYFFETYAARFERFADKIVYFKHSAPAGANRSTTARFKAEAAQRNAVGSALERCNLDGDDIVLLSDVDEIPRAQCLAGLPERLVRRSYCVFVTQNHRGYINNISSAALNGLPFLGPVACRWQRFRLVGAQRVRTGAGRAGHVLTQQSSRWSYVERGGWHLSSLGGAEAAAVKAHNFSHVEDPHRVANLSADLVPIQVFEGQLGRQDCAHIQQRYLGCAIEPRFSPVRFEEFHVGQDLPGYLVANKERFRRFFFFTDILDAYGDKVPKRGEHAPGTLYDLA